MKCCTTWSTRFGVQNESEAGRYWCPGQKSVQVNKIADELTISAIRLATEPVQEIASRQKQQILKFSKGLTD